MFQQSGGEARHGTYRTNPSNHTVVVSNTMLYRTSVPCATIHTQEFFEQFPQENGSIFLFNGYTGEAIYDVDRWGSPIPGARKLSHWFEPTVLVPANNGDLKSSEGVDITSVSMIYSYSST